MGTIWQRGSSWYINYRVNGRRYKEKIGRSKTLAKQVLAKREVDIAEKKFFPQNRTSSITFAHAAEKWWRLHGQNLLSRSTRYPVDKVIAIFGNKRLREISVSELQEYYNERCKETSVSTANHYLALVAEIFNSAKKWGDFLGENPAKGVVKQRIQNRRDRFLSPEEIDKLVTACPKRILPVIICALMTGMRKGEILGLNWENVDLEQNLIYILQSKSGKPRKIPIAPKLKNVFLTMGAKSHGSVFDVPDITLRRYFANALEEAGIANFRFHDLRHTFASHFIMKTNNLPALQKILGHYSPLMTQRYAHIAEEHIMSEMRKFEHSMNIAGKQNTTKI